ncbi:MAG: hypothetical protein JW937_04040, partial [Candidatus Omnitrophica bacterium]|nr:hypothetical protein [Candidatus Omnitrophota bacterium]
MTARDLLALGISYAYILFVLGFAEALRARLKYSPDFTRKVIHVSVGSWIVPTFFLFDSALAALIPPLSFVFLNSLALKKGWFRSMKIQSEGDWGTVYLPLSFVFLIALTWNTPYRFATAVGLLMLAWGDASAALAGR